MRENEIGSLIINAGFQVHKEPGPGLFESTYEHCLAFELLGQELSMETQLALPVIYKNVKLDFGYQIDIRVERKVII